MIIAVDPGQNVGLAFRFNNGNWGTLTVPKVPDGDDRLDMVMTTLERHLDAETCTLMVYEDFKTMSRYISKYGLETVELIGVLRAVCYMRKIPVVHQTAQQRYFMVNDAKELLKSRSLMHTNHEVSALSHLLAYEHRAAAGQVAQVSVGTAFPAHLAPRIAPGRDIARKQME